MGKFNRVSWMEGADFEESANGLNGHPSLWQPAADVLESENHFLIQVELPGMTLDDVTVELKGHQLVIYGRIPDAKQEGVFRHHVVERPVGRFARAFNIGSHVNPDDISATLKNGLLTLTLEKKEPRSRSIPVD
ncbi:Hsp20/alpha crystallin family protein [Pseudodesulfovibrio sp.]|uniref:Hsp20/alpha crystallin family protein n=1 Tax=unclassified Pseudodesulfovibrio TaxID=2661612 RepID=UPI003AFF8C75